MSIFTRFTDIMNSNLNALLDKAEDPEKMVRMMILEMEETLVEVRSAAARIIADQKEAERRIKRLKGAQGEWQKKAELALSKDRDDLAKGALMEKAKLVDTVEHLDQELKQLEEALAKYEHDIVELEKKLKEARAKKATIEARHKTAQNHLRVKKNLYDNRIDSAFQRFEKVEQRLDRIEGEAESYELGQKTLADEFAELETEDAINAELEALKAKVAKKPAAPAAKKDTK